MDRGEPQLSGTPTRGPRRCAVLGAPIGHSLSPVLHRAAYAYLGLDWTYEAVTVREAELQGFLDDLDRRWRGLSLTMPLKRAAVEVATDVVEPVTTTGVANTLVLDGARRTAYNTDVGGLRSALVETGLVSASRAVILGSGSTAVAAVAAMAPIADRLVAAVRSPARASAMVDVAQRLSVPLDLVPWSATPAILDAPVVVSTVPVGAADEWATTLPSTPGLLLDVVYDPWPTPLARAWAEHGGQVLGGLDMLVHQAAGQVTVMTGATVPVEVLRDAGQRGLASRAGW